jgi:Flp pilus assembly protein TadD
MRVLRGLACGLAILTVGLGWLPAHAQRPGAATFEGTVVTVDGVPVADAEVSATTSPERGGTKTVKTKKDGKFKIPFLNPGPYRLAVSKGDLRLGALHVVARNVRKETTFDADVAVSEGRTTEEMGIESSSTVTFTATLGEPRPEGAAPGQEAGPDVLAEASRAIRENRLGDAEPMLRTFLEANPDDPGALYLLGVCALQGGRAAEAKTHLERALELNPTQPGVRAQLATANYQVGDKDKAVALLREEVDLSPGEAAPLLNLGIVLQDLGRKAEAAEAFERAIALSPTDPGPYMELVTLYTDLGREADAEAMMQRLEAVAKPDPRRWFNIGASYSNRGDEAKAEMAYRKSLEADPNFPEGHRELGFTLLRKGDMKGAVAYLETYLKLRPDAADKGEVQEMLKEARKSAK